MSPIRWQSPCNLREIYYIPALMIPNAVPVSRSTTTLVMVQFQEVKRWTLWLTTTSWSELFLLATFPQLSHWRSLLVASLIDFTLQSDSRTAALLLGSCKFRTKCVHPASKEGWCIPGRPLDRVVFQRMLLVPQAQLSLQEVPWMSPVTRMGRIWALPSVLVWEDILISMGNAMVRGNASSPKCN